MKLHEVVEKMLQTEEEDERARYCQALVEVFSHVSITSLKKFQANWRLETGKTFEQFIDAQNVVFQSCVDMEMSVMGQKVRQIEGLKQLVMDTEITVE